MKSARRNILSRALVFGTVAFACSDAPAPAAYSELRFHLGAAPMPDFLEIPFPSDAYLKNGRIVDPLPGLSRYAPNHSSFLTHELGKMNGFSRIAMVHFLVDQPGKTRPDDGEVLEAELDPTTLPRTETDCVADASAVFLLDLEAVDPAKARVACRARVHKNGPLSSSRPTLAIGPARGIVLEEGHRYAAVVTNRLKDRSGAAVRRSQDFDRVARGGRTTETDTLYADAYDKSVSLLGPALAGAEVIGLAPYTTAKFTSELYELRALVEDEPAPVLQWDTAALAPMGAAKFAAVDPGGTLPVGFTASLDDYFGIATEKLPDGTDDPDRTLPVLAHDKIAAVGTAVFDSTSFLVDKGGLENLDHATFSKDTAGVYAKRKVKIWVTFSIPKGPIPSTGFPVVFFEHGLNGSRQVMFDLANTFAKKGWVTASIDTITFGARAPDPKYQKDLHTDSEDAPGAKYKGPDGISDSDSAGKRNQATDLFGNLQNFGAARDQLRQCALDFAQVARILASKPDLTALKTGAVVPTIDPDRIAYMGNSMGAIEGALFAPIEPRIRTFFLDVGGAGLIQELASRSPEISQLLSAAGALNFGVKGDYFYESHPVVTLFQTIVDPADPINYARFLDTQPQQMKGQPISPRNILQTEVLYDATVSNESSEALARAAGFGLAVPNVGSNSEVTDLKNPKASVGLVPLPDIFPGADGTIHDTPQVGITSVVVQSSPGEHGDVLVRSKSERSYEIPYSRFETSDPFPPLRNKFKVRCPYREVHQMAIQYFDDAFNLRVPRVSGWKTPVRDTDDDGATDDVDADPNDQSVK